MTVDADALLAGARGRRLCLEYAVSGAYRDETSADREAAATAWWAASAFETSGTTILFRPEGDTSPFVPTTPTPAQAARALDAIGLDVPVPASLRTALAASVDAAMYWQPPDGRDHLCATAELRAPLRRVATVIAGSPAADWWTGGVAEDDQWAVHWEGAGRSSREVEDELRRWREATAADEARAAAERPADPTAAWSGQWWSIPPSGLVRTTRSLGKAGPAGLWFGEDSMGADSATATPVDVYPARVIEIRGPEDWAQLCAQHPLDVTASRRQDWFRVTGSDRQWVIPDWAAVAAEADAVHLTVAGYLSAATRLIEVDGDRASVLAAWNPDETFWFRGTAARPAGEQRWRREDDGWERVAD
ncbi:hypothetical protein [Microbacterium sp. NPDC056569]|uniref:hypothetical protein n=1 Tax=Microbacterium sp. NPDC056569 TaxID=3345867 RepID=UPI00367096D0